MTAFTGERGVGREKGQAKQELFLAGLAGFARADEGGVSPASCAGRRWFWARLDGGGFVVHPMAA
jgi:hypothetical protein